MDASLIKDFSAVFDSWKQYQEISYRDEVLSHSGEDKDHKNSEDMESHIHSYGAMFEIWK